MSANKAFKNIRIAHYNLKGYDFFGHLTSRYTS